jgi:hypothetical protein
VSGPVATPVEAGTPCDECGLVHDKCSKHRKRRDDDGQLVPCGGWPIRGSFPPKCRMHAGVKAAKAKAEGARRLAMGEALVELQKLGHSVEIDPSEAMLEMVFEAAGNVAVLRRLVQGLSHELAGVALEENAEGGVQIVPAIAASSGSTSKLNEALPHVFVVMYNDERERLVKWAKACRDAGVDERRVELAEKQARLMADAFRAVLDGFMAALIDAGLAADVVRSVYRDQVPGLVRAALTATSSRAALDVGEAAA